MIPPLQTVGASGAGIAIRGGWLVSAFFNSQLSTLEVGLSGFAGFVYEVAEVALGVAAAGVLADFEFFGDDVKQFVDGAAFHRLLVHFELRSQMD
jgi:hypothetical protein